MLHTPRRVVPLVGAVALALVLAACSPAAPSLAPTTSASPASTDASTEAAHVAAVEDLYEIAFNDHDPQKAADLYLGDTYIQHNAQVADGADGFVTGVQGIIDSSVDLHNTIVRIFVQGPLVAVHSITSYGGDVADQSVMDFFAFEDGKIVEHWDAAQDVPATTVSGHTMFDGDTTSPDHDADVLDRNTAAALDFLDLAFNQAKAQEAVDTYVAEPYVQHNTGVADGGAAFVEAFAGAAPLTGDLVTVFPRTVAQGDFVVVQTFAPTEAGSQEGSGSIDIFRFNEDGKIVEHWDAVQSYGAETVNGHTVWDTGR